MLSEEEIRTALHASRVVPVPVSNPHGPLGLEQLADAVAKIIIGREPDRNQVRRPIALPMETWTKLDSLARELGKKESRTVAVSDVVTALVLQGLNRAENP